MLKLSIEEVNEYIRDKRTTQALLDGHIVEVMGVRLTTFATKGTDCICCGRVGLYYQVDHNERFGYHLNLYSKGTDNKPKLMTRDHIIPHSAGGPDTVENMNTMCSRCNKIRGVRDLDTFLVDWKAGVYNQRKTKKKSRGAGIEDACKNAIQEHIDKFGVESYLCAMLRGKKYSKQDLEALHTEAVEREDTGGQYVILRLMQSGNTWRTKMSRYFRATHNQPKAVDMTRDVAFSILKALARYHLKDSNDATERRLRNHLELCKGIA